LPEAVAAGEMANASGLDVRSTAAIISTRPQLATQGLSRTRVVV
jgi:hypothetical protein